MNEYILRLSNNNDINKIVELYEDAKKDKFTVWSDVYPTIEEINIDITNNNGYLLVDDKDNIIGGISIELESDFKSDKWKIKDDFIEISRICIRSEFKGHNLSLLMIDELIKIRKSKSIHLAVEMNNIPAIKNYLKYGFNIIDKIHAYEHDYYVCEKLIYKV